MKEHRVPSGRAIDSALGFDEFLEQSHFFLTTIILPRPGDIGMHNMDGLADGGSDRDENFLSMPLHIHTYVGGNLHHFLTEEAELNVEMSLH